MSATKLVQIDAETLETLKGAAWLWSMEPTGSGVGAIRRACYTAQSALVGTEQPEPEPVVCRNCGLLTRVSHMDGSGLGIEPLEYTCTRPEPENPEPAVASDCKYPDCECRIPCSEMSAGAALRSEPAAPVEEIGMPDAVRVAWLMLDMAGQEDSANGRASRKAARAFGDWWRTRGGWLAPGAFQATRLLVRQVEASCPDLCKEGYADLAAVLSVRAGEALDEIRRVEGKP